MYFAIVLRAVLFVGGILWCREIFGRLRTDVARLKKTQDAAEKSAIVFFWVLTLVVLALMVDFAGGLALDIATAF